MRFLPLVITLALLLGLLLETSAHPTPADAAPFHATAARMINQVPYKIGDWDGMDEAIPPAARALLRPNALLSRTYRNRKTGVEATMIIVQCRDTRDMGAHYPPVCYPAAGWEKTRDPLLETFEVNGVSIPVGRYGFRQPGFASRQDLAILSFFALPGKGHFSKLDAIINAGSDYLARPFGAAQIQLLFNAGMAADEQAEAARVLLAEVLPIIRHLGGPTESGAGGELP